MFLIYIHVHIKSVCVYAEDDNDIDDEGENKEGEKVDQTPLAGPINESGSSSKEPDAKA